MVKDYKVSKHLGPAGITCPCCTDMNSKKKMKKLINKSFRHKMKINVDSIIHFDKFNS